MAIIRKHDPKVSRYSFLIGLTRQRITPFFFFFKEPSFTKLCTLPCGETSRSTPQPRLIWVCMSSTALVSAQHATSPLSNRAPFSCFSLPEIGRGLRERGLANTVGAAAAAPRCHRESQPLLLLCAYRHCHNEEKGHRVPSLGGAGTKLRRSSGDSDARTSPQ